jgi:predicted MFS family arabinose efflux permease
MGSASRVPAVGGNGWPLIAAGTALVAVTYGLARYGYGLYLPTLRAEFALSATTAGTLASVSYASYCLAICLGAALSARGGARGAAILAGATAAVGMGLIAVAHSTSELGIGVAVAGASTGFASPPLVALVADRVRLAHQNRAQTAVNAGTGLGVLVAGPSALLLATHWRWSWALFAALSLAVTVGVATTTRPVYGRAARPDRPAGPDQPRRPGGSIAARPALATAAIGLGLASSAYWTFGRDLLAASGTATNAAGAAWIVLGAASILAAVTGDLVARYRIDVVWASLLLLLSLATAGLALAPQALPIVLASTVLFGASYVALTGILILWASRIEPHRAATAVAATFLLLSAGQLVGATLIGMLIDHAGWTASFLTAAAGALAFTPIAATANRNANAPPRSAPAPGPATQACP